MRKFCYFLSPSRPIFFKERLGLKLTHKRITTKVVLPVSKGKGAIQGEV